MTTYSLVTAARVRVVRGPAASGKTTALVGRVARMLEEGADPASVCVVVGRSTAVPAMRGALARAAGEAGRAVRVTTAPALALDIADDEGFTAWSGRRARVMTDVERAFLREDLRVSGKPDRRIREMMGFFERGWSELREDDEDWLVTDEERSMHAFVKGRLAFYGELHPAEVAAFCVRWIAASPAAARRAGIDHLVIDDAQATCRASQVLACALARETLDLAWDPLGTLAGDDVRAHAAGLDELCAANEGVEVVDLDACHASAPVRDALANLVANPDFSPACSGAARAIPPADGAVAGEVSFVEAPSCEDEPAEVADAVAEALGRGVAREDVYVATPGDAWTRAVCDALAARGIASAPVAQRRQVGCGAQGGDPARFYVALGLVAEPLETAWWRCWCGFGDHAARSLDVARLIEDGLASGEGMRAQLERMSASTQVRADGASGELIARFEQGLSLVEACRGLAGASLVETVARELGLAGAPEQTRAALGAVGASDTAPDLLARLRTRVLEPTFASTGVRVGGYEDLLGLRPRVLVLSELVNGLVPPKEMLDLLCETIDHQRRMRTRVLRRLYGACGCAAQSLTCVGFSTATVEQAERLGLDYARIRLVGGVRTAQLTPSVCRDWLRGEPGISAR